MVNIELKKGDVVYLKAIVGDVHTNDQHANVYVTLVHDGAGETGHALWVNATQCLADPVA